MTSISLSKPSACTANQDGSKGTPTDPQVVLGAWHNLIRVIAQSDNPALKEAALSLMSAWSGRPSTAKVAPPTGTPGKRFNPCAPINAVVIFHLSRVLGYWRVAKISGSLLMPEEFGLLPAEARRLVRLGPVCQTNEKAWFEILWSGIGAEFAACIANRGADHQTDACAALRSIVQFSLPNKVGAVKDSARGIRITLTSTEVEQRAAQKMRNDLRLRALRAFRATIAHAASIPALRNFETAFHAAA